MQKLLTRKRNKGFTLIELIVVIAVIAILVLLAMPKFLDYTREAKITQIKNDVKVAEEVIEKYLIGNNDKLPEDLDSVNMFLEVSLLKAFDTRGLALDFESGDYKDITSMPEIKGINSKLPGIFASNNNGKVYYVHDATLSNIEETIPNTDDNTAVDGTIIDDSLVTGPTPIEDPSIIDEAIDNAPIEMDRDNDGIVDGEDFINEDEYINGYEVKDGIVRYFLYDRETNPRAILIEYIGDFNYTTQEWSKSKEITIPSSARPINIVGNAYEYGVLGGLAVGEIGANAFNADITGHELDVVEFDVLSYIKVIGPYAFANNNLTEVKLRGGINLVVGDYAFYNNHIENMTYLSVESFGNHSFEQNNLTSVIINHNVTFIGDRAFANNKRNGEPSITLIRKSLDMITPATNYAESVNSNGDIVDQDGNKLTTIYNAFMSNGVFAGSTNVAASNPSVCALTEDQKLTGSIIGSKAAHSSWAGKFVSDQVHQVGDYWFGILVEDTTTVELIEYTGSETDIVIPGKITADGTEYEVTKITGPRFNWGVFESYGANFIEIPCTITHIGEYTFYGNNLTNITIPSSVVTIKDYAFMSNPLIMYEVSLNNPNYMSYEGGLYTKDGSTILHGGQYAANNLLLGVTTIGNDAFSDNEITSVTIPDSVTTIGEWAFYENNLTSVTIPDSVTTIGNAAFAQNNLTSVTIPDSVTTIGDRAFSGNNLTSVTIPDSVTIIGEEAFSYNDLTSVTIPDSVTTIGDWAFFFNRLTSVTIPDSVITIGNGAFGYNGPSQYSESLPSTGPWTGTWNISGTSWVKQ